MLDNSNFPLIGYSAAAVQHSKSGVVWLYNRRYGS